MSLSHPFDIIDRCSQCHLRIAGSFCDLPETVLRDFDAIIQTNFYSPGIRIFAEGQLARGVFILCSGRVKFSLTSSNGKSLMRIAETGEILGLSATLANAPYEASAEMLEAGQVNFIRREYFMQFLEAHGAASLRAAQILSRNYQTMYQEIKSLVLADSVAEKFARLLLGWCARDGKDTENGIHLKISLTHTEIAQMIGSSRETVTRLFGELKNKQVIQLKGSNLFICNKAALERFISS
ncbi:MAG: Crp/Fnr family transcriptional regulator [Acidobacteriota bacterium]